MITAKACKQAIKKALKEFGAYSYFDKGPDEVMDLTPFVSSFRKLTNKDRVKILKELARSDEGELFVESLIARLEEKGLHEAIFGPAQKGLEIKAMNAAQVLSSLFKD